MKTKLIAIISLTFFAVVMPASAANPVAELKQRLAKLNNVAADFEQRVIGQRGELIEQTKGVLFLKSPGKFKWQYADDHQLIVSDGKQIQFLMNDLEQVIIRDFQEAAISVPSLVLVSDLSKLDELFTIRSIPNEFQETQFELMPKSESASYDSLLLTFVQNELASLRIIDGLGQITEINLQGQLRYRTIPESEFTVSIPSGFDVVKG